MKFLKPWEFFDGAVSRTAKVAACISAVCLVFMIILATADIIGTKFFKSPIYGAAEMIEDLNVPLVLMALAYVQLTKGHISGAIFDNKFSTKVKKVIKLAGYCLGIVVCGLIGWQTILLTGEMIEIQQAKDGAVHFLLWPFALSAVIGLFLLLIAYIVSFVRDVTGRNKEEELSTEARAEKEARENIC